MVWLYAEPLTLVDRDEPPAQYRITYQPDQRCLKNVTLAHLFETPHRSPHRPLWAWGDDERLPALGLPAYTPRRPCSAGAVQPALVALEGIGTWDQGAMPPATPLTGRAAAR